MKRLWLVPVALLLLLATSVLILFNSEGAMHWTLQRTAAMVPGELTIESASGRFAGPITLNGLHYRSDDFELHADEMTLDWSPLSLLRATLEVTSWHSPRVAVTLKPDNDPAPPPPEWRLPWRVELAAVSVDQLTLARGEETPQTFEHAEVDAVLWGNNIDLQRFRLSSEHITLKLSGSYAARAPFPLDVRSDMQWQTPDDIKVAARGRVHGNLQRLVFEQTFSAPFSGILRGELHEPLTQLRWNAALEINALELAGLRPDLPAWTLHGALQGHGVRSTLVADGSLAAVHPRHGRLTGNLRITADESHWQLHELTLLVPDSAARLRAHGDWRPDAVPPITMTANWHDLVWPLSGPAQFATREGNMTLRGSPADYTLDLDGFLAAAPLQEIGVDAGFSVRPGRYQARHIRLRSGAGLLAASGTLTDRWSAEWQGELPQLAGLWPQVSGSLQTSGRVRGPRNQPLITGTLAGRELHYPELRIAQFDSTLVLDLQDKQDSRLDLQASDLLIKGQPLKKLQLKADGRQGRHDINVQLNTSESQLIALASGGYNKSGWRGHVSRLAMDTPTLGSWNLAEPVALSASPHALQLGSLCWLHAEAQVCASGQWLRSGGWQATASARKLPLGLLQWLLPQPLQLSGTLDTEFHTATDDQGSTTGRLQATLSPGALHLPGTGKVVVLDYRGARLQAEAVKRRIIGDLAIDLADSGTLQAQYDVPWPAHNTSDLPLRVHLLADVRDLRPLSLAFPSLDNPRGRLSADLAVTGTGRVPQLTGEIHLREATVNVPSLGVQWQDIDLTLQGMDGYRSRLNGTVRSGDGTLRLQGTFDYPALNRWSARIRLDGENFELVKTPRAWLLASPQLDVDMRPHTLGARGEVTIPRGRLAPRDLSQSVRVSPDALIIGAPSVPQQAWEVSADIRLNIGEQLRFDGFDFGGWITGNLRLEQQPRQAATGSGELRVVSGYYDLYGQKLVVERGTLQFAGGPIDDPALDLRASRQVREIKAGVQARGTLKAPQLTLFSEPALDQSDILSYLLLGRPASEAGGGDSELLYRGAMALGLAGGELLAKRIGSTVGIDEVRIEPGTTEATTSLVLGTYLTPQVYLSYGIGLFQPLNTLRLRYQLGRHWQIEAQSGEQLGADLLYTIER